MIDEKKIKTLNQLSRERYKTTFLQLGRKRRMEIAEEYYNQFKSYVGG